MWERMFLLLEVSSFFISEDKRAKPVEGPICVLKSNVNGTRNLFLPSYMAIISCRFGSVSEVMVSLIAGMNLPQT